MTSAELLQTIRAGMKRYWFPPVYDKGYWGFNDIQIDPSVYDDKRQAEADTWQAIEELARRFDGQRRVERLLNISA